ncbi:MAG: FAD-binding oxidoreductase [Gemmatimonadaceae bacterium]|nr:FAD-binding oxidoreductase [Gemmatimonadaceae bacterium]MCW5827171.1 FAD-binding oxidoreductase [Gemmatimonadaceae bacterium]
MPSAAAAALPLTAPPGFRGIFRSDDDARAVYSEAAGIARILPRAVAVPQDAEDVVTLVQWAVETGTPLTARGAGSSMANGAVGSGVIVDLYRLDTFGPIDSDTRRVVVGPAVTRNRVEREALKQALIFPVDPSSGAFASIGGMCATNAAGARSVKYGAMRAWVTALDCVFANGARAWVRRGEDPPDDIGPIGRFLYEAGPALRALDPATLRHAGVRKESSGYGLADWLQSGDLVDVLIGSEGTLAIIVGVELRLAPLPGGTAGLLAGFPDLEGAAAAAVKLAERGASAVEMLDRSFLEIAASAGDPLPVALPAGLDAVLIVEVEADTHYNAAGALREMAGWCEAGGATFVEEARDPHEETRLWQLRHAASPILNRLAPRVQSMQFIEDACVPPARFAAYVRGVRHALQEARVRGVIFGHAGDGHAHVNPLIDVRDADWRARMEQLITDVTVLVASLGGTLAGEHGDGRLRAALHDTVWSPEARDAFAATKQAFDPAGILNPGVIVPAPGAKPLEDIKYDPALPALPPAARAALDEVVKTKGWGKFRLDLLSRGR